MTTKPSAYSKVRKELADQVDESRLPCRYCGAPTLRETLTQYGARCFPCYEGYCREPQTFPDIGNKSLGPRDWARALKRRHEAGETLTPTQISAYQGALAARQGESG